MSAFRTIYIEYCTETGMPELSNRLRGKPGGVSIVQSSHDTKEYRFYFKENEKLVDPPAEQEITFVAKLPNQLSGEPLISHTTDASTRLTITQDNTDQKYLSLFLAPQAKVLELLVPEKGFCPEDGGEIRQLALTAEIAWSDGVDFCRAKALALTLLRPVTLPEDVQGEILEQTGSFLSAVVVAPDQDMISGQGKVSDPLVVKRSGELVDIDIPTGTDRVDMSDGDYGALNYNPVGYFPVAVVLPTIDDDGRSIIGRAGDVVKFSANVPAGYKLQVLALRKSA